MSKRLAIFASGGGSNAEEIIRHFSQCDKASVSLIVSNKASAFVLERAKKHDIKSVVIPRNFVVEKETLENALASENIDFIILAGFLLKIPEWLINKFPNQIVNIHPALLPKYGGKGMYGKHVHQAVFDNFEKESGITIHYVNGQYDEGQIIFQKSIHLDTLDTPVKIASKVLELEHQHYAETIESLL